MKISRGTTHLVIITQKCRGFEMKISVSLYFCQQHKMLFSLTTVHKEPVLSLPWHHRQFHTVGTCVQVNNNKNEWYFYSSTTAVMRAGHNVTLYIHFQICFINNE